MDQQNTRQPAPENTDAQITQQIIQDIQAVSDRPLRGFQRLRAKQGVYVYKCLYDGMPAVAKYFEKEEDRREIHNYRILTQCGIPTLKVLASASATLVMEDVSISEEWRLGIADDLSNMGVGMCLAQWYFALHEKGFSVPSLGSLYFEYDHITRDSLETLIERLPEAAAPFRYILSRFETFRDMLYTPPLTLTYNDFYWTNLAVRKDEQEALMFDYNLLGRGYRSSDLRNVCSSLSKEASVAFLGAYDRFYFAAHKRCREKDAMIETQIDAVAASLFALIAAFKQEIFPSWANDERDEALSGALLAKARALLT